MHVEIQFSPHIHMSIELHEMYTALLKFTNEVEADWIDALSVQLTAVFDSIFDRRDHVTINIKITYCGTVQIFITRDK